MIIISSSKYLYMGNKMLQYAVFIAFSEETGVKIANPSFAPYSHHFKNPEGDFFMRYPIKRSFFKGSKKLRMAFYFVNFQIGKLLSAKKISNKLVDAINIEWDKTVDIMGEEFRNRANKNLLFFVMGWDFRQSFDFGKYRDKIKSYFEPLDKYQVNINNLIDAQRKVSDLLIGIHIRHGDYRTFEGGKYFHETPVYAGLMLRALSLFPGKKVKFIVCSNEKQDTSHFGNLNFTFGTDHPVEDMYSLAACDYMIGAPSTFTIWASFYGNTPIYMIEDVNKEFTLDDFKIRSNF